MRKTVEAVYENGVFKPLGPVGIPEGEHVQVLVSSTDSVELLSHMYDGMSEEEIEEIDSIITQRSRSNAESDRAGATA